MPNRSSHAGHIPQRTCVVCRRKTDATALYSFCLLGSGSKPGLVFDLCGDMQIRKSYVCQNPDCLDGLNKWIVRAGKKRKTA